MDYCQLNPDNSFFRQLSDVVVEWDSAHKCKPSALTAEEAAFFRVFPFAVLPVPSCDPVTETVELSGGVNVNGEWKSNWVTTTLDPVADAATIAANLAAVKLALATRIDSDAALIYAGVPHGLTEEYRIAEEEADQFKASGYLGPVPASVSSWSVPMGQTSQWAADDIIATAAAWRNVVPLVRQKRLSLKTLSQNSTTSTQLAGIAAQWDGFFVYLRAQLHL